jgi:taurine transport system permease protein
LTDRDSTESVSDRPVERDGAEPGEPPPSIGKRAADWLLGVVGVGGDRFAILSRISLVVFLAIWELVPRFVLPGIRYTVPPLSVVIGTFFRLAGDGSIFTDTWDSTSRVVVGFLAASTVGVPAGVLIGVSPKVRAITAPYVAIIRPLPSVAWIPISMAMFGLSEQQKYSIIFMGSLAPVLIATIEATVTVDDDLLRAARNLGASKRQVMFRVLLPAALPQILAGLKVAMAVAWTCVISAELVGSSSGLGYRLWSGKDWNDYGIVLVCMAAIVLIVVILDKVLNRLIKWLLPWQEA